LADINDFLTEEEKAGLICSQEMQKDAAIEALLAEVEAMPEINRLAFCRKKFPHALPQVSQIKAAQAEKRLAKLLGVSVRDIRKELNTVKKYVEEWIDSDDNFVPPPLAEKLMEEYKFQYDRQDVFVYQDGVYKTNGGAFAKKQTLDILADRYRDMHGNEIARYIETKLKTEDHCMDTNPLILNLENGIIDIADWRNTGLLTLKKHSPEILSSIRIPVTYDPNATCPRIQQFFSEVLPSDCHDLICEIIGHFMFPDCRFEKAFMLVGEGSNGKSTLLKLIRHFIGDQNISCVALQDLTENRFAAAELSGKLVNIFPDLSSKMMEDSAIFKALVSGDDIKAERKGRDPFKIRNTARLMFSANELPRSRDNSYAFFRRWIIVKFSQRFDENSIKRDPNLLEKLTTPQELSGLLNLALEGFARLCSNGKFTSPESAQAELELYKLQNDTAKQFIDECCDLSVPTATIPKVRLYKFYSEWCMTCNYKPISQGKFNERLVVIAHVEEKRMSQGGAFIRVWSGIQCRML